jgi:cytosine/adenosine deaminase-related metal-dependent hydrolase
MRRFQQEHPAVSSREVLEMCTINPASALRQADQLGKIRPGFYADFIAIPARAGADVFDQIVGFDKEVISIMIAGSWVRP